MSLEIYSDAIAACHACASACEQSATEGLDEMNVRLMTRCLSLTRSCADVCFLTERELARDSVFAERLAQLCAELCDECAAECIKHDLEHCQLAGDACRRCADTCRELSAAGLRN